MDVNEGMERDGLFHPDMTKVERMELRRTRALEAATAAFCQLCSQVAEAVAILREEAMREGR